jgi:hypothetical protein
MQGNRASDGALLVGVSSRGHCGLPDVSHLQPAQQAATALHICVDFRLQAVEGRGVVTYWFIVDQ